MEDDYENDTAFVDMYGDLDELVSQRRAMDQLNGRNSLLRGVQAQLSDASMDASHRYEVKQGISESLMGPQLKQDIAQSEAELSAMRSKWANRLQTKFEYDEYVIDINL